MVPVPDDIARVFERYVAAEYAYFTPKGEPLCWPVTPYWYPKTGRLAIATGLAYPKKADYAKRNPKVAMLFSDATSSGLPEGRHVLVQARAEVRDEDIQANTDRYIRELRSKFPAAKLAINRLTVRTLDFYLPRLWVDIDPVRISEPRASAGNPEVTSAGIRPVSRLSREENSALLKRLREFDEAVVTCRGAEGYPEMIRTAIVAGDPGEVILHSAPGTGAACLTMHRHTLRGLRFQAYMVRGTLYHDGAYRFVPSRLVGFFGNGAVFPLSAIPAVKDLRRQLRAELDRRGASMPKLRIP